MDVCMYIFIYKAKCSTVYNLWTGKKLIVILFISYGYIYIYMYKVSLGK